MSFFRNIFGKNPTEEELKNTQGQVIGTPNTPPVPQKDGIVDRMINQEALDEQAALIAENERLHRIQQAAKKRRGGTG